MTPKPTRTALESNPPHVRSRLFYLETLHKCFLIVSGMWWPMANETFYVDMEQETTTNPNPVGIIADSFREVLIMFLETVKMMIVDVIKGRGGNEGGSTGK